MHDTLRILVVDDDPGTRRGIVRLLSRHDAVEIVGDAEDGRSAVRLIREKRPDLVFLDVDLPDADGFAVLEQLDAEDRPEVVFVTAYDQYAVRAFEFHAVDYLLKPFDAPRLLAAMDRGREAIRRRRALELNARLVALVDTMREGRETVPSAPRPEPAPLSEARHHVVVKNAGEVIVLRAEEIDWIEADGDYMKFHVGGRSLLQRETMASLEARLDPLLFRRIHRSTIVNLDRVAKLTTAYNGEHVVQLKDGTRLKVSKGYQEGLQEWLRAGL
ncbi:MAG: DNA-binding response regulator [Verrucomicrobia bacterium]|nr:MAG: DNA-binding response regulator [Verrucomicrobiota bacterium]